MIEAAPGSGESAARSVRGVSRSQRTSDDQVERGKDVGVIEVSMLSSGIAPDGAVEVICGGATVRTVPPGRKRGVWR